MDIKNIDEFLIGAVEDLQVPSIAAIIVNQEKILYEGYYGFKNINTQEKINQNTLFRIASMTKPITSLCIFQLIERGFIKLDTNIEDISDKYKILKSNNQKDIALNNQWMDWASLVFGLQCATYST